jgi:protein-tyrosine phosphatase
MQCLDCSYIAELHARFRKNEQYANFIIPGLFVGNQEAALQSMWLKAFKIQVVLSIREYSHFTLLELKSLTQAEVPGVEYHRYDLDDRAHLNISQFFVPAWNLHLKNLKRHLLINCMMGVSRSVTLVCSILMRRYCVSDRMAIAWVRYYRYYINPNLGFCKQLRIYHLSLITVRRFKALNRIRKYRKVLAGVLSADNHDRILDYVGMIKFDYIRLSHC